MVMIKIVQSDHEDRQQNYKHFLARGRQLILLQIFQLMHSQKLYFFNWENWVLFNIDRPQNIPHSQKLTRCNGE